MKAAVVIATFALLIALVSDSAAQVGRRQTVVDPNVASEKELSSLPHLNAALVKSIIGRRPFLAMSDLDTFLTPTLNDQQRSELYRRAFVALNLNTASDAEIMLIPGLGKRMLGEFREYRPYTALAQFRKEIRKYVDDQELARLEQYVFVPINLNTATDDDILSIPGMGQRMLHEFKEYRPYKTMQQFRREIGKYVDEKEVARLERYVTLN
jgi:DNA uptake protein ComE-like DNA-binding protein